MNNFFYSFLLVVLSVAAFNAQKPKSVEIKLDKKDPTPTVVTGTENVFIIQEAGKSSAGKLQCKIGVYNSELKRKKELKFYIPKKTSLLDYSYTDRGLFLIFTENAFNYLSKGDKFYSVKVDLKKYKIEECLLEMPVSCYIPEIQAIGDKLFLGGQTTPSKLDSYFKLCCSMSCCGLGIPLGMVNIKPKPVFLSIDYKTERISLKSEYYKMAVISNIGEQNGFNYSVIRKFEDEKISSEIRELDSETGTEKSSFKLSVGNARKNNKTY